MYTRAQPWSLSPSLSHTLPSVSHFRVHHPPTHRFDPVQSRLVAAYAGREITSLAIPTQMHSNHNSLIHFGHSDMMHPNRHLAASSVFLSGIFKRVQYKRGILHFHNIPPAHVDPLLPLRAATCSSSSTRSTSLRIPPHPLAFCQLPSTTFCPATPHQHIPAPRIDG
jgi:hypothetical protein